MKRQGLLGNRARLAALALTAALLTLPSAARAGGVDIAIGLNFPLPGFLVPPPMAAPPRVVVTPPPQVVVAPAPPVAPPMVAAPEPAYVAGGPPHVPEKHHKKHKQKHCNGYRLY